MKSSDQPDICAEESAVRNRFVFDLGETSARRIALAIIANCLLFICSAQNAMGLNYSVKGELSYELQRPNGESEPLLRHYELQVEDCKWKVSVKLDNSTDESSFVYQYDGQNITYYARRPNQEGGNVAGMVEAAESPQTWLSTADEFAWLALASHCYFAHITNGRALSFEVLRSPAGLIRRFQVPVKFTLSAEEPHLPTHVAYFTDKLYLLGNDGVIQTNELAFWYPHVDQPYKSGEFNAQSFTNLHGLSFPTRFEYRAFHPRSDARTASDLKCMLVVRGTATNIVIGERSVAFKLPSASAYLQDLRVSQSSTLLKITNGVIPSTNDPQVLDAQKRASAAVKNAALAAARRKSFAARRTPIVVVLGAVMISGLAFFWHAIRKRRIAPRRPEGAN